MTDQYSDCITADGTPVQLSISSLNHSYPEYPETFLRPPHEAVQTMKPNFSFGTNIPRYKNKLSFFLNLGKWGEVGEGGGVDGQVALGETQCVLYE